MKPQYWIGLLAIIVIAISASAGAWRMDNSVTTTEEFPADTQISQEKAIITELDTTALQVLIDSETPPAIIDTRTHEDFVAAHIPEAVSLPSPETSAISLSTAAPYKTAPVVFYCGDATCESADISASIAVSTGYTQVYIYREGFGAWQVKKLPIAAG